MLKEKLTTLEFQNLLRSKILDQGFFYENLANNTYCGIHNLPLPGKYIVIAVQYNWVDYDLFFDTEENCMEFIHLLPLLDLKIKYNSASNPVKKNI